jgi:hypothetical protein
MNGYLPLDGSVPQRASPHPVVEREDERDDRGQDDREQSGSRRSSN